MASEFCPGYTFQHERQRKEGELCYTLNPLFFSVAFLFI